MPLPRTPLHSQAISAAQCEPKETLWPRPCNVASRAYPLSSLQCTSAFSANSAIAVSVCPFNDARCSAINLHCRDAPINTAAGDLHSQAIPAAPPTTGALANGPGWETAPSAVLAVHDACIRSHQHLHRLRVPIVRGPVQRGPPAVQMHPAERRQRRAEPSPGHILRTAHSQTVRASAPQYPSSSLASTSASAATSAFVVSVCPSFAAQCSAVHLHRKHTPVPARTLLSHAWRPGTVGIDALANHPMPAPSVYMPPSPTTPRCNAVTVP